MNIFLENPEFLTTQIITYIGNKRTLIGKIEEEIEQIKNEIKSEKLICADLFSGSGIVARMFKKHSSKIIVNDLENYSFLINSCYLSNKSEFPKEKYDSIKNKILEKSSQKKIEGIITKNYAPQNDEKIKPDERVFYTHENALLIDTYRTLIDEFCDEEIKKYFLAPLITEASIHVNTSGIFKGFYKDKNGTGCFGGNGKNALSRILGKIELKEPVLSNFETEYEIFKEDTVKLSEKIKDKKIDVVYLDPPYNQHPYGSNYFMLNLIIKNKMDIPVSDVSGITQNWNRSVFNKKEKSLFSMEKIISNLNAKYVIISYNSEGFISFEEMTDMLKKYGKLKTVEIKYNTFRGSRNLKNRDIHVSEYLFVLKK